MGIARQWLCNMTAGLLPRRLVVYHQQDGLVLEFEINKNVSSETIEPLLSQIVWRKGMAEIKEIRLNKHVFWEVLDVLEVKIVSDCFNRTIKVAVVIRTKILDPDGRLSRVFGKKIAFKHPCLKYVFHDEEKPDHQTAENNNNDVSSTVIQIQFRSSADKPPTRRTS